ncbi:sodium:solute symporter family protein [Miniphocaeibacter massiliensis]|uniref:sodium:solute symporter family protein n=1 Tax=Miniphocaeibacter massiliensis TaxID=2041841 RepID=UPI000C1C4BB4|nr:sodium:solute symporter family protein [Miniphocaeibacter massiliensis]
MEGTKYATFFLIGFVIYTALMIFIGWYTSRGKASGSNYLNGGGNLPIFLIFGTMGATLIGTGSSIGATANGFKSGWAGAAYGLGAAIGIFVLVWFTKKVKLRSKGFNTMTEEAMYHYNGSQQMRVVMAIMMFVIEIIWLGNHMNGGATYLSFITGIDMVYAKLIMVLGFSIYILIGGYLAVVWTDFIQFIIICFGFVAITFTALSKAGGWSNIQEVITSTGNVGNLSFYGIKTLGLMGLINLIFSIAIPMGGTPTYRLRIYTSKDDKSAGKALKMSGIALFIFSFLPALIGMAAFVIATKNNAAEVLNNPDFSFTYIATSVLGPMLGLIFMISGLSATLSSGDSDAIAAVNILLTDVYPIATGGKHISEKKMTLWSRIATIGTLALAFIATLFAKDVMSYITNVIGSIIPGVSVAMFVGALWKKATWQGGLAAVIGGTGFGISFLLIPAVNNFILNTFKGPSIPATIISLILIVIVSLGTKNKVLTHEEKMKIVMDTRNPEVL